MPHGTGTALPPTGSLQPSVSRCACFASAIMPVDSACAQEPAARASSPTRSSLASLRAANLVHHAPRMQRNLLLGNGATQISYYCIPAANSTCPLQSKMPCPSPPLILPHAHGFISVVFPTRLQLLQRQSANARERHGVPCAQWHRLRPSGAWLCDTHP